MKSTFAIAITLLSIFVHRTVNADDAIDWPPDLRGARQGTVIVTSPSFLQVPESVEVAAKQDGAVPFTVATAAPTIALAYHRELGPNAVDRRLWSSWGDICVAADGRVYCGIGDHGNDVGGDARCFLYCWEPKSRILTQVVDMNRVVPPQTGQPAWSKIHARIDEGADGGIYFSCTLNDGNRAKLPTYRWTDELPGGQIYRYDPTTGETSVVANLPPRRCTATSQLDRARNVWWCNLEAGDENGLWAIDLKTRQSLHQTADGSVGFNRNFALLRDGSILFNSEDGLAKYDPAAKAIINLRSILVDSPGMRCSTRESSNGNVFGITHKTNLLFRYSTIDDALTPIGPNWLAGSYTAVCVMSPDERFVYFLPGSHGGAFRDGTPVVQYEIRSGQRKVLAFLAPTFEHEYGYVPAGTYGVKISADGGTLYVNFNGHAADANRPAHMKPNGFGLCAFAAIQIPRAER